MRDTVGETFVTSPGAVPQFSNQTPYFWFAKHLDHSTRCSHQGGRAAGRPQLLTHHARTYMDMDVADLQLRSCTRT